MDRAASPEARAFGRPVAGWRRRWFAIIFESKTPAGRYFDIGLLLAVLASVLVVILETVDPLAARYESTLMALEWGFTLLFTVEYVARLCCVERPLAYARSFYGLVDLASVLPMYLTVLVPDLHVLIDIRLLRLLRVFRILKLTAYVREYTALGEALAASRRKVIVFLSTIAMLVIVLGTVMYVVEGPAHGFTSIPVALYWAVTTMTTIGSDLSPGTALGQAITAVVMLIGWGILAVPTGIVTAELASRSVSAVTGGICAACGATGHAAIARFCHQCGAALSAQADRPGEPREAPGVGHRGKGGDERPGRGHPP